MVPNTLPFRDINLKISPDSYVFTSPSSPNAPALAFDRPTGDLRLVDPSEHHGKRVSRVSSIAGILGVIQLRLDKYVIIITKAKPVGRIKGNMVYKVVATELLPMRERQIRDPDEDTFTSLLANFMKNGPMYFSYSLDLTSSFQRQSQHDSLNTPLWQRADDRFFFNRFLQQDLVDFRTRGARGQPGAQHGVDPYILPVIFGMMDIRNTTFKGVALTLILVSRRSRFRVGTRYFTRGVDDDGNVANYNETEQILIVNDGGAGAGIMQGFQGTQDMQSGKFGSGSGAAAGPTEVLAYVQTRGSVPTYWAEVNSLRYVPRLAIRSVEAALPAARKHFDQQIRLYGDNYLINLVNHKGREQRVKESYEKVVEMLVSASREHVETNPRTDEKFHVIQPTADQHHFDRLHYVYYDFHSETKGMQMHRAYALIEKLAGPLREQGYFRGTDSASSRPLGERLEPRRLQTSVMRTNCMDCLDRTNVVQSMFARHVLDRQLEDLGLMTPGSSFRDEDPAFEHVFRNMWADNADVISCSYAGTGAMKTDLTRTGVRTKTGTLNDGKIGLTRYVKNNFLDGPRQDAYDLFTGSYLPGAASIGAGRVFADRRPVLIQALPYLLAFSVFVVLVGLFSPRGPDATVLPLRIFVLVWTGIAVWCAMFIFTHGQLFVNWPKLNPRPWAMEAYNEHLNKAKHSVIGQFVPKHDRGLSVARYLNAEEGKKRIE